jgi:serine/threonine protein kinase
MIDGDTLECLDEDALLDFLAGRLDSKATARAREHLGACPTCKAIATDLIRDAAGVHAGDRSARAPTSSSSRVSITRGATLAQRYLLVDELGEGGMGIVWRAIDSKRNEPVAIKQLKRFDAHARRRFLREIAIAQSLHHPELVRILDVIDDVEAGIPALVMELVPGESLDSRLTREARLGLRESLQIAAAIARPLEYIHAKGIVHRDLKPANVLLSSSPPSTVKVLDLGLARADADSELGAMTTLTRTGHSVGTPSFMAPEQLGGERAIDLRADIWALGVILYTSITGERPFAGHTIAELLRAIHRGGPPVHLDRGTAFPPALSDLLRRMLATDRRARPASMAEVLRAMDMLDHSARHG